jgi:hypothetical protein
MLAWGAGTVLFFAAHAASAAVTIDHAAVSCVVAGKYPRFEARFDPAADVSRARLHFRPAGSPHWYSVAMKSEAGAFTGVLPKPKPTLTKIEYYIEVTDTAFGANRTREFAPEVDDGPLACKDKVLAAVLEAASVIVEAPAGAPLVPVGFEPAGVISTTASPSGPGAPSATAGSAGQGTTSGSSGGGSTSVASGGGGIGKTGLIIGGVAAAGAGIAIAASGGGDDGGSAEPGGGGSAGGGGGGGTAPCTPGPVTASLANQAPAQRCGQRFAVDIVVSNGTCANLQVQSVQLTQTAVAGPFCSAAVTNNTYTPAVTSLTASQTRTVMNFQSNVFCCAAGTCPGVTTCTYNETFSVQTSAGPVTAGTMQVQVAFDPGCPPCP